MRAGRDGSWEPQLLMEMRAAPMAPETLGDTPMPPEPKLKAAPYWTSVQAVSRNKARARVMPGNLGQVATGLNQILQVTEPCRRCRAAAAPECCPEGLRGPQFFCEKFDFAAMAAATDTFQ